ncbi:hypothetical protein [Streptomyces montanisoli]|uniref:PIN domain-containing protein n=1 Tax=Streptomyces montanisoli TaxID=2798581 RepID=A0A940MHU6_9ACTN|nr:hypothetical protein [Streptomyces montanisoli]MBP0459496.1 hypothetical protein [Streptomyces montanisoli]
MSFPQEPEAEESTPGQRRADACILDAVVCVHFAGANLNRVLVAALESMEWVILVPAEGCDEIARKDAKYPGLRKRWLALERSDRIRVLPALEIASAPARVVEVLEEIRDLEFDQALRRSRDLGECVAVAHGVHLSEQGLEVTLLMDDAEGRQLADEWSLQHLTIEDVLVLAVHAGCFDTLDALKQAYRRLQQFGSGLPDFPGTALVGHYREWMGTEGGTLA